MEGVQSSRLDETFGGRVEHTGLIFKTVPQEQVQDIINKLDGKTAYQLAELLQPITINGKKYSGSDVLNALKNHINYITYLSFVLTADEKGNVHLYLRFEGNRYALKKEAAAGDERAQLLLNISSAGIEGEKLAEAVVKNTGFFVFNKKEKSLNDPVNWRG
ncbi:MAG: hypothetical protein ACP5KJ_03870 [Candidatus Micrarchaeia archaeon]